MSNVLVIRSSFIESSEYSCRTYDSLLRSSRNINREKILEITVYAVYDLTKTTNLRNFS